MKPKGKKNLSEKFAKRNRTTSAPSKPNPFELYLTKAKHNVIGRSGNNVKNAAMVAKLRENVPLKKRGKAELQAQGLRSVARTTALQSRKKSLLNEYRNRTKKNRFIDKRIGEKDASMSVEDKMLERVMLERRRSAKTKKGLFNLNDDNSDMDEDDDLSFGQKIAELEAAEEDDREGTPDDFDGTLGEKFVSDHHFGGGLLKKAEEKPAGEDVREERRLAVEDIIAESKQRKYEKQSELDEIRQMTDALDSQWGDAEMRKLISSTFNQPTQEDQPDIYDGLVKMLQFEKKAKGTDKLKNESELAKDARDALEKAEKKRLKASKVVDGGQDQPDEESDSSSKEKTKISNGTSEIGLEMLEPLIEDFAGDSDESGSDDEEDSDDDDQDDGPESNSVNPVEGGAIPFVIPVPSSSEEMEELLKDRKAEDCLVIVERIMKYHHISLAEENRSKLSEFFLLLADNLLDKAESDPSEAISLWKVLTPSLVDLFHISLEKGREFVKSRLEVLSQLVCGPKRFILVPSALIFLKFVSLCFPPDHQNPITECMCLVMGKLLVRFSLKDRQSLLQSNYIATLATEYSVTTRRYFPELINHFKRIFLLGIERTGQPEVPENAGKMSVDEVFLCPDKESISPVDRLRTVELTMNLIGLLFIPYSGLPAYAEIFADVLKMCRSFIEGMKSKILEEKLSSLEEAFGNHRQERQKLSYAKKKPQPMKMLEPRLENKFEKAKAKKKSELKKLIHDKKRAMKSAKREIRRDNQFLSRIQMEEQAKKDSVRRQKVKEIYSGLYAQEGEHNALKRKKQKLKM